MPGLPLIDLIMLAAYVNLYAMVSIRHAETRQLEQVYTCQAIDTRCHITLAKLIPGRIIGPYATLYLCYVNSRAVDFTDPRPRTGQPERVYTRCIAS